MKHILLIITVLMGFVVPAHAADDFDYTHFKTIPVLNEGRVKPIGSFAHGLIQKFSGQNKIANLNSEAWLANMLFDPARAANTRIFKVPDGLKKHVQAEHALYSFDEIKPVLENTNDAAAQALQKDQNTLSEHERTLLAFHDNAAAYLALMRSFSGYLPLDIVLPANLSNEMYGTPTYAQLLQIEVSLKDAVVTLINNKGRNPATYTPEELGLAKAAFSIESMRQHGKNNALLKIIPAANEKTWNAPWQVLQQDEISPDTGFLISNWQVLAEAYRSRDTETWNIVSKDLLDESVLQGNVHLKRLDIENTYRALKPYTYASAFYAIALLLCLTAVFKNSFYIKIPAAFFGLCGAAIHTTAIGVRMYILDRPPVGTFYESLLFVSLICAVLALLIFVFKKRTSILSAGLLSAFVILAIAPFFAADDLGVLTAVLNTDFWLATHVLTMTIGYAVCVVCACLAHFILIGQLRSTNKFPAAALQDNVYKLSIAALLFTLIGTVLGGIWADQSWGRFWGWDPKENGALLVVLWLIWAQHGRIGGHINAVWFNAVLAYLNVIVALAWFGVNMLGVGLHSYGFASGTLNALIGFCVVETILVLTLGFLAQRKVKRA